MRASFASISLIAASAVTPVVASCAYGTSLHPRQENGQVKVNTFGYTGNIGPVNWVTLAPENQLCATGTNQSPIDMVNGAFQTIPGNAINLQIPDFAEGTEFENLGTTVEVIAKGGTMTVPGVGDFTLQQFHFHLPSEHLDNGNSNAMEMHMVWQSANGQIAVIGAFIDVAGGGAVVAPPAAAPPAAAPPPAAPAASPAEGAPPAEQKRSARMHLRDTTHKHDIRQETVSPAGSTVLLETVFSSVGAIATPGTVTRTQPLIMSEVVNLLAAGQFQTYSGSLTTPPCSEGVTWLVASQKLSVQPATFAAARDVIGFNSRFPQNSLGEPNLLQLGANAATVVAMQQALGGAVPPSNVGQVPAGQQHPGGVRVVTVSH